MVTIVLDIAENGVIKVLEDSNVNGGGEVFTSKLVYNFSEDPDFKNRLKFIKELCLDIGLQLGNEIDGKKININLWKKPKEHTEYTEKELRLHLAGAEKLVKKYKRELKKYES